MLPPILIAGSPRSGTSLTAGLLKAHGVAVGECLGPAKWNQKGHFENRALKDLMKVVLQENGYGTTPLDKGWPERLNSKAKWRGRVFSAFSPGKGAPWLVKESRILMTWPLWRDAFPQAIYVFPRRPADDILRSMIDHPGVSRNGDPDQLWAWIHKCWERQEEIAAHADTAKFHYVDTDIMARGDMAEAKSLVEFCGLTFNEKIADRWIDQGLWHA